MNEAIAKIHGGAAKDFFPLRITPFFGAANFEHQPHLSSPSVRAITSLASHCRVSLSTASTGRTRADVHHPPAIARKEMTRPPSINKRAAQTIRERFARWKFKACAQGEHAVKKFCMGCKKGALAHYCTAVTAKTDYSCRWHL
ncbi:MAG: hypothetical protein JO310_08935 [Hyphomicrobiales bacterium]|nr:hypothetical protein [Hyphomicrobiales bacterium]